MIAPAVAPGSSLAGFELRDGALAPPPAVLGYWAVQPSPPAGDRSFAPAAGDVAAPPVWRISLPADPILAARRLADAEATLAMTERALPAAEDRLRAVAVAEGSGLSFATATASGRRPEAELLTALDALNQRPSGQDVVFAHGNAPAGRWERVAAAFRAAVDRLRRLVGLTNVVETEVGERLVGRTVLGEAGGTGTVWRAGTGPADATSHSRAVALVLGSRVALLRSMVLAARGAVLLPAVLSGPGGALLALPAAWRFVDDVVAEVGAIRALREEG